MADLYHPLNIERREIRRLMLFPGVPDDPLAGEIQTVSLDDSPQFEALSYVWGQITDLRPMRLNSRSTSVTSNLDVALRHLRHQSSPRALWVDALCINQDDADERASQVNIMNRIYGNASTVLIWLGAASIDGSSDTAMHSIDRFDKAYWQTYDFHVQFMEILYRPWFTRVWVVQEFTLARHSMENGRMRNPRFGCGKVWVDWLNFITAWAHFSDGTDVVAERYRVQFRQAVTKTLTSDWVGTVDRAHIGAEKTSHEGILSGLRDAFGEHFFQYLPFSDVDELSEDIEKHPVIWRARSDVMRKCQYECAEAKAYFRRLDLHQRVPITYHGFLMQARGVLHIRKERLSLEDVIKGTMNLRCTDPRDKIFGILGLLDDQARVSIPVNYHQPAEWTFLPTMLYVLQYEPKSLSLLGLLWRTRHFKTPLPSWVPDFTISADFKDEHNPVFLRGSCANAQWAWPEDARAVPSQDSTTLNIKGISFGKVTHILAFVDGERQYYVSCFRVVETVLAQHAPRSEPLWRTLVGIRNTDAKLVEPFPEHWEVLLGRQPERDGEAQKMFQDCILPIVRQRKFFITDQGFAGVATPMIEKGDTIAILAGMGRAAVLRDAEPGELGLKVLAAGGQQFHRITGFAYVGCHDRGGFDVLQKAGDGDWRKHVCLDRLMESFKII